MPRTTTTTRRPTARWSRMLKARSKTGTCRLKNTHGPAPSTFAVTAGTWVPVRGRRRAWPGLRSPRRRRRRLRPRRLPAAPRGTTSRATARKPAFPTNLGSSRTSTTRTSCRWRRSISTRKVRRPWCSSPSRTPKPGRRTGPRADHAGDDSRVNFKRFRKTVHGPDAAAREGGNQGRRARAGAPAANRGRGPIIRYADEVYDALQQWEDADVAAMHARQRRDAARAEDMFNENDDGGGGGGAGGRAKPKAKPRAKAARR